MRMADTLLANYGKFRVVTRPSATHDSVFVQGWTGSTWKDLQSFNVMSDDYAYTNAREAAQRRQQQNDRPEDQP